MEGSFMRCIYNFDTIEPGEISLKVGDIVEIKKQVDASWLNGTLGHKSGNFPSNFVEPVSIPSVSYGQKVFAAIEDFHAQTSDDLSFKRGDVILGVQQIDSNWWSGDLNNKSGIFPVTHVRDLNVKAHREQTTNHAQPTQSKILAKARAILDLTAQLDDELSFNAGDIINVTEKVDSLFYMGQCNGDNGMFPASFVEIIENYGLHAGGVVLSNSPPPPRCGINRTASLGEGNPEFEKDRTASFTSENTWSYDASITPYAKTLYPFTAQNDNELTFTENDIVELHCHIDDEWLEGEIDGKTGIFPATYVEIIVDCPYAEPKLYVPSETSLPAEKISDINDNTTAHTGHPEVYGLVKYDFPAENEADLDLREGDTVTILKRVGKDWFQAQHDDGHIGICPANFIELIGPEPDWLSAPQDVSTGQEKTQENGIVQTVQSHVPENTPQVPVVQTKEMENKTIDRLVKYGKEKPQILKPKPVLAPKPVFKQDIYIGSTSHNVKAPILRNVHTESKSRTSPIDISLGLDDIVQTELKKAKEEVENRSRSSSALSSGSSHSGSTHSVGLETTPQDTQSFTLQQPATTGTDSTYQITSERKAPPPRPTVPWLTTPPTEILQPDVVDARKVPQRPAPPRPTHAPLRPVTAPTLSTLPPTRPAPPVPTSAPKRPRPPSIVKSSPADIMGFNQDTSVTDLGGNDNVEVIGDLKNRMKEIEGDIEQYNQQKQELQQKYKVAQTDLERPAIEEEIEYCDANIHGLSSELENLIGNLRQFLPGWVDPKEEARKRAEEEKRRKEEELRKWEERMQKMKEKREHVIQELICTEKAYLKDLQLCVEAFLSPASEKNKDVDMETLFGNIEEVAVVAQRLLASLERAVSGKAFKEQLVGPSFVSLSEDMKHVYALYCRNHDDVLALLEKYESNIEIQGYFKQGLDKLREHTTVFDLGAMLIKPVQRILKYPLLLNELLKSTDDNHADKSQLVLAINAMTDVATAINEYKRRKDLVYKYRKDSDSKFSDKISKLTIHSIKKKSARLSMRLSTNLGIGSQTRDEQFDKEETKFRNLEKSIRLFVRNVTAYCDHVQDAVTGQETNAGDIADFYGEKSSRPEVEQYVLAHRTLGDKIIYNFKSTVERRVMLPLNKLTLLFHGPTKVIQKRHDKLLDYDSLSSKLEKVKESDKLKQTRDDVQMAKNNYEALNAQLLDELPKLYNMSLVIFKECIGNFIQAHRVHVQETLHNLYPLLDLPIMSGCKDNVLESFGEQHFLIVDRLSELKFVPRSFNPKRDTKSDSKTKRQPPTDTGTSPKFGFSKASPQSDSQKVYIRQLYPSEKVFRVTQTYTPGAFDVMDISIDEGSVVGVIKEQDPLGNKDKWFVDNGAIKGFIPKMYLSPASPYSSPEKSSSALYPGVSPNSSTLYPGVSPNKEKEALSVSLGVSPSKEKEALSPSLGYDYSQVDTSMAPPAYDASPGRSDPPEYMPPNHFRALYSFTARNENETSLVEGEIVVVLQKHDQEGNPEWWLVEGDDMRGYVPANYLAQY